MNSIGDELQNVKKYYETRAIILEILRNISNDRPPFAFLALEHIYRTKRNLQIVYESRGSTLAYKKTCRSYVECIL